MRPRRGAIRPKAERSESYRQPADAVRAACLKALEDCGMKVDSADDTTIEARTGLSMKANDKMTVTVAWDQGLTKVACVSRPRLPTQLVDYGENAKHVREFFSALERRLGQAPGGEASAVVQREVIIKEIVKMPCRYCGTLVPITDSNCSKCGAPLR